MRTKFLLLTKFLIILAIMTGCKSDKSEYDKMVEFGQEYTNAWNSKNPVKMASFYEEDGSLAVNGGTGNKGDFSGFEEWTMSAGGLVQESIGSYDVSDYERQLNKK